MAVDSIKSNINTTSTYDHSKLERKRNILRFMLKNIGFPLLAKVNPAHGLENFPISGPAIVMINHIAFIDPLIVVSSAPRNIVPLAKIEVYEIPVFGIFPRLWEVIPVKRDDVDRSTLKQIFSVLNAGEIILIAPEGTRSPQLKQGKEGIAYIASRSSVPVVPAAVEGTEGFPALRYTKPWHGTGAMVKFGRCFRYRPEFRRASREDLRIMTDEAMYILASMLPPNRRGVYSDSSLDSLQTIEWV